MATHRERVLRFVDEFPGRDDDEIAAALNIVPRQTVNAICRDLSRQGLLRRECGPRGKFVNFLLAAPAQPIKNSSPDAAQTMNASFVGLTEDQVKAALSVVLEREGWSVKIAWGRARGIDIEAVRQNEKWIIECKGSGSSAPMQNNYFLGVVGELLQRMHDDGAKHSVAFPDIAKFRRLWSELPSNVKRRLQFTALFVAADGSVRELS